jgi:F0F1-type ATP synthase epsilon subunit
MPMQLEIYRLEQEMEMIKNVSMVTVPTVTGMRGLLPYHMDFMGELKNGVITIQSHPAIKPFEIQKGFVEFQDNVCRLFIE